MKGFNNVNSFKLELKFWNRQKITENETGE